MNACKYQGVEWGLFKNTSDPKPFSSMDFNFKQNPVEPDYIKPIKAEVLEL